MSRKAIFIYLGIGFILLNFQNCAQTSEEFNEGASFVSSIDPVDVGALSFPKEKLLAYSDQSNHFNGLCEQSGALIRWSLETPSGDLIEGGLAECDQGVFSVSLGDQWLHHCDQDLFLQAQLGAKASSKTLVETVCL